MAPTAEELRTMIRQDIHMEAMLIDLIHAIDAGLEMDAARKTKTSG